MPNQNQTFVKAQQAVADVDAAIKREGSPMKNAQAEIVSESADGWLIHVTMTAPKFYLFGLPIGKQQLSIWVKGNRQHERHDTLVVTGDSINNADDAGALYGIWEVPDCVYIWTGRSYDELLAHLRGEHAA